MSCATTTSAAANVRCVDSRSPTSQCQIWLDCLSLSGRTSGAPGSSALKGSTTGSSASYSTSTACAPSAAAYRVSATTTATSCDWYTTWSVGNTIWVSLISGGMRARPAASRSLPVTTATTPGTLSACEPSILVIMACAYGLRTMSMNSMPGNFTSSM